MQEMSYNNYLDADVAWNCVSEFTHPTCGTGGVGCGTGGAFRCKKRKQLGEEAENEENEVNVDY